MHQRCENTLPWREEKSTESRACGTTRWSTNNYVTWPQKGVQQQKDGGRQRQQLWCGLCYLVLRTIISEWIIFKEQYLVENIRGAYHCYQ